MGFTDTLLLSDLDENKCSPISRNILNIVFVAF